MRRILESGEIVTNVTISPEGVSISDVLRQLITESDVETVRVALDTLEKELTKERNKTC
jgi:hypothetical protein